MLRQSVAWQVRLRAALRVKALQLVAGSRLAVHSQAEAARSVFLS